MSQVLAANAALGTSQPVKEAQASARGSDCFAAVFDRAQSTSRRNQQEARRSQNAAGSLAGGDQDRPRVGDKTADRGSRTAKADHSGRVDQLREAAEKTQKAANNQKGGEAEAQQGSELCPNVTNEGSPDHIQVAKQANQELTDATIQQNAQCAGPVQASATSSGQAGPAAGADSGAGRSAAASTGCSDGLPGTAVSLSATTSCEPSSLSATGTLMARAQAVQAVVDAGSAEASVVQGAKPAGGPEGQTKPVAGAEFQNAMTQATRGRQPTQSLRVATASKAAASSAGEQPVNLNAASGTEDLARVLRSKLGSHRSNMTIQLDPPELGQVRVNIRMLDETMTVRFETQTQAGHDALRERMSELTGTLEQQGIKVDRVEIEYRPPSDTQDDGRSQSRQDGQWQGPQFADDGGQGGRQPSFGSPTPGETAAASAVAQAPAEPSVASGVDLLV